MTVDYINNEINSLVDAWCERRALVALAGLLPGWLNNNGLTDGWEDLAASLRTMSNNKTLPPQEREKLKRLWVQVDTMLRNR